MKKALGLLLVVCYYLHYPTSTKNTLEDEISSFSIENIDDVNQIYFADRMNNEVTLIKENNSWIVDENFLPEVKLLNYFSTLEMKIKYPVSESMHNSVSQRPGYSRSTRNLQW